MGSVKEFKQMSAMCCDLFRIELNLGRLEGEEAFPGWLSGKESACNPGNAGLSPGSGRSPGEGNGNPL